MLDVKPYPPLMAQTVSKLKNEERIKFSNHIFLIFSMHFNSAFFVAIFLIKIKNSGNL